MGVLAGVLGIPSEVTMDMPLKPVAELQSPALGRVAEALGCSVDDFFKGPEAHPLAGAIDLLRLWDAADGDAGRDRILACARMVVGQMGQPA